MSMISGPILITGGVFSQNIDQRQGQKSAMDHLKEAVAHTAFHNSGERFEPPRCHPNTRVAVLDKIEKWALRMDPDTRHASILWLSGAAGAGKSAIAQTLAERFHSKGLLVASFFFGRSDLTRNHARSLVSTIVYQLYSLLPPLAQSRILAVIGRDPLIFTKSLLAQFEALIVHPLQPLFENGFWISVGAPRLIIIDGLDECLDRGMQRNVLLLLSAAVRQFHLPFTFLLASRPEHDIRAMFSSPDFLPIYTRLFLDDTYLPDHDIELFLRDQFAECRTTHPFRQMIPPDWPSDDVMEQLISKSSGQFIYASVVAKYVNSSRHRPHHRLDIVLNLRPTSRDLPFSELDALYNHIFSNVDNIDRVLDVISFQIIFGQWSYIRIIDIEHLLRLEAGEVAILLCDLASVIGIEGNSRDENGQQLTILHASLVDYLLDSARSKEYFIDITKHCAHHIVDCFLFMSNVQFRGDPWIHSERTAEIAMICFEMCHLSLGPTESLYNAIRGFSIHRICNSMARDIKAHERYCLLHRLALKFLPALFKFLKKLNLAKYLELYQQHQSAHDLVLRENIKAWSPDGPMSLFFSMVTIYRKLPIGTFHESFSVVGKFHAHAQSPAVLQTEAEWDNHAMLGYLEYLSDFLRDPKRSREFCAGPKLFAQAAKYCLFYLCDHTAFEQEAMPRMSVQQRMRRKHTPWKWHRRVLREDIRGPRDTPWLWLRRPDPYDKLHGGLSTACVLHRKTNDLIYVHYPKFDTSMTEYNDPVIFHRIHSEKYHLALICLNYFLPRAAKLGDLAYMCQKWTLASRSQDFRRESARARSHMQIYAAQWGCHPLKFPLYNDSCHLDRFNVRRHPTNKYLNWQKKSERRDSDIYFIR